MWNREHYRHTDLAVYEGTEYINVTSYVTGWPTYAWACDYTWGTWGIWAFNSIYQHLLHADCEEAANYAQGICGAELVHRLLGGKKQGAGASEW